MEDECTLTICTVCGGHLFETDPELSKMEHHIVWSHLEDTGCDDPTPKSVFAEDHPTHNAICLECMAEIEPWQDMKEVLIEGQKHPFHLGCSELALIKVLSYKPTIGAN